MLQVKVLSDNAMIPTRGSPLAAGYDLSSAIDIVIPAQGKATIPTNLAFAFPEGVYGRIAPRSGLAHKHHLDVGAGVIDADYRGDVGVVLFNHAETDFKVNRGDRIAQLILECYKVADLEVVERLEATVRGNQGYGSTGVGLCT